MTPVKDLKQMLSGKIDIPAHLVAGRPCGKPMHGQSVTIRKAIDGKCAFCEIEEEANLRELAKNDGLDIRNKAMEAHARMTRKRNPEFDEDWEYE